MAWDGTQTLTNFGSQYYLAVADTIDADAEITDSFEWFADSGAVVLIHDAGSNAPTAALQHSVDGTVWADAQAISDGDVLYPFSAKVGRFWRINVTTVGVGNEFTAHILLKTL